MERVTKDEFYKALSEANRRGLDPMPSQFNDNWTCQKTGTLFGRSVGSPFTYYLVEPT